MFIKFHIWSIVLTVFGMLFASSILRQRRAPGSAIIWLALIVVIPYIGIPAYLILGRRKTANSKEKFKPPSGASFWERINATESTCDHIVTYDDGVKAFEQLEKSLLAAKEYILFETFIFEWDETGKRIFQALLDRAENGVKIRVLLDGFGQPWGSKISARVPENLRDQFQIEVFSPALTSLWKGSVNLRNHRKLVIIDGTKAFVGGMNVADEYMGPTFKKDRWQDFVFALDGKILIPLIDLFKHDWFLAAEKKLGTGFDASPTTLTGFPVVRVSSGPDKVEDPIYDGLLKSINLAKNRILIATPYFIPDEALITALTLAIASGVEVQIIVPGKSNHPMTDLARGSSLRELQHEGAKIFYFPKMIHAKLVTIDGESALIGSANIDIRSLFINYELGIWIFEKNFVHDLEEKILALAAQSTHPKLKINKFQDIIEGLARILSPML